jgi:acyl dehydratase
MTDALRGRFHEDVVVGDVYRSHLGRNLTETDNIWFSCLTMNTNQVHFNSENAPCTEFGQPLVVSTLTLALVLGLSVRDTSENAAANPGWGDIVPPQPISAADTLGAESEILTKRESSSRPACGIVPIRTRGVNQRREVVFEFNRSFMAFKRDAPGLEGLFPATEQPWSVPSEPAMSP